jgi:hypothetical protein
VLIGSEPALAPSIALGELRNFQPNFRPVLVNEWGLAPSKPRKNTKSRRFARCLSPFFHFRPRLGTSLALPDDYETTSVGHVAARASHADFIQFAIANPGWSGKLAL